MALHTCILNLNVSQKQLALHGSLGFPCSCYIENKGNWAEGKIPWHWHDELEIINVVRGVLKLHTTTNTLNLMKGDCAIINSGILHSADFENDCEIKIIVFHSILISGNNETIFSKKYIEPLINNTAFRTFQFNSALHKESLQNFTICFESLLHEFDGFEYMVRNKLSEICYVLYLEHKDLLCNTSTSQICQDNLRIKKMLDFIHENYNNKITLNEISSVSNIGERECNRCFDRTIHISPMQYLLKYRMARSAEELCNYPQKSISEIATLCGFDSPSNFSKLFKRFHNFTPREYRYQKLK